VAEGIASQGAAANTPWSGHWWPTYNGDNNSNLYDPNGPLAKYDQYVKATTGRDSNAAAWEKQNHFTNQKQFDWAGHCHAWAAASILTKPVPAEGITKNGVHFTQDDLEGMIAAVYYNPTHQMLPGGQRSETNDPNAAEFKDMNPAWMHYLLQYYMGQHQTPFIMDTAAGAAVWNFPAFAYQMQQSDNGDGSVNFRTRVWFSDAAMGEQSTRPFYKDYTYTLWNTGDGRMTGDWSGESVNEHPDFAWVPTGKSEGGGKNPNVDERVVEDILGYDI
jgi:hypothetical protein